MARAGGRALVSIRYPEGGSPTPSFVKFRVLGNANLLRLVEPGNSTRNVIMRSVSINGGPERFLP